MTDFNLRSAAAAAVLCLASASASASILSIDVSGTDSWDELDSPNNVVLTIDVAAALGAASGTAVTIDGLGWELVLETFATSWLSEATIALENSDQSDGLFLTPGLGDDFAGGATPYTSGGILDLVGPDLDIDLFDGILVIQFFESFDDAAGFVDATWIAGTLELDATVVPVPAALPLLLSALGIGAVVGRRRKVA